MVRRRVLLVGSDSVVVEVVEVLREYFQHGAYEVESVEYCDDALTTLRQRSFDLVLLLEPPRPMAEMAEFELPGTACRRRVRHPVPQTNTRPP
jgi:CheY-like chemotaxis protein